MGDLERTDLERTGTARGDTGGERTPAELRCDFCGAPSPHVRRVALDRGYERLQTPHRVRYACPTCSEAKERSRGDAARG